MYKSFLEAENDKVIQAAYCDTIMMIYDQRIKYFHDEGNVLGRKGVDLLRYRREDGIEFIREGYDYLKKSVEIEGQNSSVAVLTTFVTASISLYNRELISREDVVMDYLKASEILENELAKRASTRTQQAKEAIDVNIRESKALSCEMIVQIFAPKFTETPNDPELLKKISGFLSDSQCESEKLFADVSEKLYEVEPSPIAAYKLARVFLSRKEYDKSAQYYREAAETATNPDDKATYYYELSIVTNNQLNQHELAANYVGKAIDLKPNWGEAYILLGTIYGASVELFDDAFKKRTVYWIAVDMFQKAKNVDPSTTSKANGLISDYSAFFPGVEDIFFNGLREGQSYLVEGYINKLTTVRAKK
jgi:tetratricopeptide (TPR) repeat protein